MTKTGIFETIFKRPRKDDTVAAYFQTLNGYTPAFSTYEGGLYEMELTRAAINAIATFASKLKPEMSGKARRNLEHTLQFKPNPFMDTTKFLYRLATILAVNNTAFIVPVENLAGELVGYYPIVPTYAEVVDVKGVPYMRYTFGNGRRAAIEFDRVGVLTQFAYKDDFFGESNAAMQPTMQLLHAQNQGMVNAIKNSATIRFIARLGMALQDKDIEKERERFTSLNLSSENHSGVLIQDAKIAEIKQVNSTPYTVNAAQMKVIQDNVYQYFGVNAAILENNYTEDQWNAFYEGKIEPFALQLSLVMSNMTYSQHEIRFGNAITFTANRLQYASNTTKLNISTQLFDRGLLTRNEIMDIWNMAHVEGGDRYYIRKEYAEVSQLNNDVIESEEVETDEEGNPVD